MVAARPPGLRTHAEGTSHEFVVWAAMPPRMWIRLPWFFAEEIPSRGPAKLWLQHVGCYSQATKAEAEVAPPGDVFMTRGWGEIARTCCPEGALAIHFEYDGASTIFFKVFGEDGRCLECCSRRGDPRGAATGVELALGLTSSSSCSSSDSPESSNSPESSDDDSYEPPSSHRARSAAAASARRRR